MHTVFSFIAGLVFGFCLIIAGMGNPSKVLAFLDISGNWDPSLALVMGGAIPVSAIAFWFVNRRETSLFGHLIELPNTRNIDRKLIVGALLFGIGWGLVGICPGPSLVLLGSGSLKALIFVVAMLTGMMFFELLDNKSEKRSSNS